MPTSNPMIISSILYKVGEIKPKTILDVGVGFGKYGLLFREYTDIIEQRYDKKKWKLRIDGLEIFKKYITPMHKYIYNNLYIGDIRTFKPKINYDLIYFGDILEHLKKDEAFKVIDELSQNSDLLISTPNGYFIQKKCYGNKHEEHKCGFGTLDFVKYKCKSKVIGNMLLIHIPKQKLKRVKKNGTRN